MTMLPTPAAAAAAASIGAGSRPLITRSMAQALSPHPVRSQRSRVRDDTVLTPHTVRSQRACSDVVNNRYLRGRYVFQSVATSPVSKVLRPDTRLSLWSPARVAPRRQQPKPIERTVPGLFSIADAKPPAKPSPILQREQEVECCICLESIEETRAPAAQHPKVTVRVRVRVRPAQHPALILEKR
jgi:hypothetical protein